MLSDDEFFRQVVPLLTGKSAVHRADGTGSPTSTSSAKISQTDQAATPVLYPVQVKAWTKFGRYQHFDAECGVVILPNPGLKKEADGFLRLDTTLMGLRWDKFVIKDLEMDREQVEVSVGLRARDIPGLCTRHIEGIGLKLDSSGVPREYRIDVTRGGRHGDKVWREAVQRVNERVAAWKEGRL